MREVTGIMRHDSGLTHRGLLVIVVVAAIAAAAMMPVLARATEHARKATCLSNMRRLTLACLMYVSDYDEVLPSVVADDRDGTAHASTGRYANWTADSMERDVKAKYGATYLDGRWMWQLGDALLCAADWSGNLLVPREGMYAGLGDYGYLNSPEQLNCPELVRRNPRFRFGVYVIGTDKRTGVRDGRDPLLSHLPGASVLRGRRKVWQSGSYVYMCGHYPYKVGARAADYGQELLSLWDAAHLLGCVDNSADPQQYFACSNAVGVFDDPGRKPLVMCRSFGVHEGNGLDYASQHVLPLELGGKLPTIPISTPVGFVDGHMKYTRLDFYDFLAMLTFPNQVCYGHARHTGRAARVVPRAPAGAAPHPRRR